MTPTEKMIEAEAQLVYAAMRVAAKEAGLSTPEWVEHGNSLMQDEARRAARALSAALEVEAGAGVTEEKFEAAARALVPFAYGAFEQHGTPMTPFEPGKPNANAYNATRAVIAALTPASSAAEGEAVVLPRGFSRSELTDMLDIVKDEEQTVDGGEYRMESTAGFFTRLLRSLLEGKWERRFRHKKRGTNYTVVAEGRLQVDGDLDNEKVVVYRGDDGQVWVRPSYEFNDGRFEALPASPAPQTEGK